MMKKMTLRYPETMDQMIANIMNDNPEFTNKTEVIRHYFYRGVNSEKDETNKLKAMSKEQSIILELAASIASSLNVEVVDSDDLKQYRQGLQIVDKKMTQYQRAGKQKKREQQPETFDYFD